MLADWVLAAAPGFGGEEDGDHEFQALPPRMTEDFAIDALEALETAVRFAPTPLAAVREARAWREVIAPSQQGSSKSSSKSSGGGGSSKRGGGKSGAGGEKQQQQQRRSVPQLSRLTHASHLLGLIGCCPPGELEAAFPSLARELLALLRRERHAGDGGGGGDDSGRGDGDSARAVALAALDEALRRLLHNAGGAVPVGGSGGGGGGSGGGNSKLGGVAEVGGGGRQAVISVLPKLVPAITACLEGSTSADGSSSEPPPQAVAASALGALEALVFLLRSTMRPHVKKVEAATALWLQGPSDVIRDRAAAVLASLPLCGEAEAWTQAAGRVALEAHGLLHVAWPDNDVDMASSDSMSTSQVDAALRSGGGLLPPLGAGVGEGEGFSGSQQVLALLVSRRFKGLCRVLELMLVGDSNGRPVAVPVLLILALVERVQRMASSVVKGHGPQAFIPVAQGALSPGALHVIRPALRIATSRVVQALASTEAPTVLRNARRFCRVLVQGLAKPSAPGSLRAAGYLSVSRAVLQLGEGAAPYLATPALPALLAEARAVVSASDPSASEQGGAGGATDDAPGVAGIGGAGGGAGAGGGSGAAAGGKRSMGIEPAMSARKSSQKKLRRSREKEVGRALAAADAAAATVAASNGIVGGVGGGGSGGGAAWTGAAALAEREAACTALSCLSQVVVCCKGHLPLGGRRAIEEVVYRGLRLVAHATGARGGTKGLGGGAGVVSGGSGRAGGGVGAGRGKGGACLEDPDVAREFLGLAQACLVTPMADGTRSGSLSIAIAAFRSFSTHPDQGLAAASKQALAGCGAILYPRAAPLHLPHAVTSQARAWGDGGGREHGLPMGWDDALVGGAAEEEDDEEESDADGEGDDDHPSNDSAARSGGGATRLSVQAVKSATPPAAAAAAPVVTPPSQAATPGAGSGSGGSALQKVPGDAVGVDAGADDGSAEATSKPLSGKGKGKGRDQASGGGGGSGTGTIPTSSSRKSSRGRAGAGAATAGGVAATPPGKEGGVVMDQTSEAAAVGGGRKRPRSGRDVGGGDVGYATDDDQAEEGGMARNVEGAVAPVVTDQEQQERKQPAAIAAVSGGEGDGDDDDDDFEFPAIVDADPDLE